MNNFTARHPAIRRLATLVIATAILVLAMGGTWTTATTANAAPLAASLPAPTASPAPIIHKSSLTGKINLNTANEEQLRLLPTVGPAKAERIVTWRKKNGGFRRIADLRRVKGFGYKTFKKLESFLQIAGDTTLAAK